MSVPSRGLPVMSAQVWLQKWGCSNSIRAFVFCPAAELLTSFVRHRRSGQTETESADTVRTGTHFFRKTSADITGRPRDGTDTTAAAGEGRDTGPERLRDGSCRTIGNKKRKVGK
ncbi:hypothetical protein BEI59_35180 [Eisenbergiella tayi]|uniref:Uncharacterized protein n=1 Tax=Eisenbergiella tayi TaxID=1432052 RepID=A0A1E3U7K2_9FIRM|nr:hypothetical protein BEI62_26755 [Eisenbergiella tayi]ODR37058.1 hypothetical protein BEI59_35180 [Eisenbergiella tayi]ODR48832.1 hypothetical protein BEI64_29455 [Eisenbergiella tayi]ODR52685.1 hypothetical protein BEI63_19910 [Eisenbergiella tayi]